MLYDGYKPHREKTPAELKRDLEYAQSERNRLQAQVETAQEREERRREQRQRDQRESYESSLREADNWPDALRKQTVLFGREADEEARDLQRYEDPNMYFTKGVAACQRALELWGEEEAKIADTISALQAQIDWWRDGIRASVAKRLEAESPDHAPVASALTSYDETEVSNWLNW